MNSERTWGKLPNSKRRTKVSAHILNALHVFNHAAQACMLNGKVLFLVTGVSHCGYLFVCFSYNFSPIAALIETLSEDRASVMQEKKQLEEELNRLRSTALVSSAFFTNPSVQEVTEARGAAAARALPAAGACYSEPMGETERLASVAAIRDDEHVDSAVEASMVTVQ